MLQECHLRLIPVAFLSTGFSIKLTKLVLQTGGLFPNCLGQQTPTNTTQLLVPPISSRNPHLWAMIQPRIMQQVM